MSAVFLPLPRGEGWGEGGLRVQEPSAKYLAQTEPALLRGFELLAADAGGAAKLRELILSLAMSGHLLPQQPRDEPASALLVEIRRIKELREVSVGRRRKAIALHSDTLDEDGRSQPRGWTLATASDLFDVVRGVTYQKQDAHEVNGAGLVPLLRANNIQRTLNFEGLVYVPENLVSDEQRLVAEDFVVCMASGSRSLVGKAARFLEDGCYSFGAFCGVVRPFKSDATPILSVFFASRLYRDEMSNASAGIGINNLKSTTLAALKIPLPPLAEQHRIVSRVEELMKLCDALEQSGRLAEEQHARLTATLFDALAASESAHALAENWGRIAEHFDLLLDLPEAIDALEQTIRQLAVDGLLVSGDERRGKFEEMTLGAVVSFLNGYAFKSEWFRSDGVRLVRNVNIAHGELTWGNVARVDDAVALDLRRFALRADDLVISLDRPIISTGLKYAVVRECDLSCLLLQRVAKMVPREGVLASAYLELWLRSPAFIGAIDPGRSNGVPHISTRQLEAISFSLPPFSEQNRVVAYAEKLLRHCAQLRERLRDARQAQSRLADALVAEVAT